MFYKAKINALSWFFIFVISVSLKGDSIKKLYKFKGEVNAQTLGLTVNQIGFYSPQGHFFTQSWTFIYYLDNGGGGYIQFSYARVGFIFKQLLVHHSHYTNEGKLVYRKDIMSVDKLNWEPLIPALKMGESSWSGFYPDFKVRAYLKDLKADLTFHCLVPGWRPGKGPAHYGSPDGPWYDLVVMIPWAEVSGTIEAEGKKKKVKGFGYCDHNVQTIWFSTQCNRIYALRSFAKNWAIHFLDYQSTPEYGGEHLRWLIVMNKGKILFATDKYEISFSDWKKSKNYNIPSRAKIKVSQSGFQLEGEIIGKKLVEILDINSQLPSWIAPAVNKLIRQPVLTRQIAEIKWHIKTKHKTKTIKAEGIFEYTIVE